MQDLNLALQRIHDWTSVGLNTAQIDLAIESKF